MGVVGGEAGVDHPPPDPVVRLEGLTKDYGRHRALDGIDLTVGPGEIFGYLGPNGAGKTTTIRLLLGLLRPTAGRATVLGLDSWRDSTAVHARAGYLPGEPTMNGRLTGRELVSYFAALRRRPADVTSATGLADRFDLDLDRRIRALSRGNRQKLAIVQAFMSDPDLVVLDEPTSGLDPLVQQEFHQLLGETTARGATVLFSSHVLNEVDRVADRVGIIRQGRLVAVEHLADLRAKALHRVEARITGPVDLGPFRSLDGVRDLTVEDGVLRCGVPRPSLDGLIKALGRYPVADLSVTEADLEELFLAYYSEASADAA
ncbi:MAG TPA: ABC transporter ATP-binding protein [Acidimicrobiales bacterium]|nr:ABC transporter ATP-binding protein [Acidimicrobiales bacterium]